VPCPTLPVARAGTSISAFQLRSVWGDGDHAHRPPHVTGGCELRLADSLRYSRATRRRDYVSWKRLKSTRAGRIRVDGRSGR